MHAQLRPYSHSLAHGGGSIQHHTKNPPLCGSLDLIGKPSPHVVEHQTDLQIQIKAGICPCGPVSRIQILTDTCLITSIQIQI